jgi:hypothetical protein
VAFALVATDDLFKHRPGNLLEKLAEHAGYLRQGWGPRRAGVDSCRKRLPTLESVQNKQVSEKLDLSHASTKRWCFAVLAS